MERKQENIILQTFQYIYFIILIQLSFFIFFLKTFLSVIDFD